LRVQLEQPGVLLLRRLGPGRPRGVAVAILDTLVWACSSSRIARTAVPADNPEPPARGTSELKTRSASALLEQYEARLGQHSLLPRRQAAAGLASRQVADYLNDLDQIP